MTELIQSTTRTLCLYQVIKRQLFASTWTLMLLLNLESAIKIHTTASSLQSNANFLYVIIYFLRFCYKLLKELCYDLSATGYGLSSRYFQHASIHPNGQISQMRNGSRPRMVEMGRDLWVHLVQPPCLSRGTLSRLPRTMSRYYLTFSKVGDPSLSG